jgi:hypothetical protein
LILVGLIVLLLGCTTSRPMPRAENFPLHATEPPFVLHWRLDQEAGRVTAVGLVSVGAPEHIDSVTVQVQGRDPGGRLVSRGWGTATPRSFTGVEPWPFQVWLRPTGREVHFTVAVTDIVWKRELMGGPGAH